MAELTNIKNEETVGNNPIVLTVVVLDEKSSPASGAKVSITPSDSSGVTNDAGEIQFTLGNATRYEITASTGFSKVTVPYYVTKNGATRLVVNPQYVKTVEAQLHPWYKANLLPTAGIVLGIVIILYLAWKFFLRRKHK